MWYDMIFVYNERLEIMYLKNPEKTCKNLENKQT